MNAGYAGTPLATKLGIKEASRVAVLNAPDGFRAVLAETLPAGVEPRGRARGPLDVVICFTDSRAELERRMPVLRGALDPAGRLWIAWPKRSSGKPTDLTEDVVRELAIANRLVDNKVAAIDDTWSGLQLVIRLADRGT